MVNAESVEPEFSSERLLLNYKHVFEHYSEDRFRMVFSERFSILHEMRIAECDRRLFLMQQGNS
jgi:hypothetical protein